MIKRENKRDNYTMLGMKVGVFCYLKSRMHENPSFLDMPVRGVKEQKCSVGQSTAPVSQWSWV